MRHYLDLQHLHIMYGKSFISRSVWLTETVQPDSSSTFHPNSFKF